MVDQIELLSNNTTFTWYKIILHRAHSSNYLTYVAGADDTGSARDYYSATTGYAVLSISEIDPDGSTRDAEEWRTKERYLFIKSICGSYYTPNGDELQAIEGLLEAHREEEKNKLRAAIKNFMKNRRS